MGRLMEHLRECQDRPGGAVRETPPWHILAEGKWHYLYEKLEDKIRMIPDLRGRYSMRAAKDDLLDTVWELEDFVEDYSRRLSEEVMVQGLRITWPKGRIL